MNLLPYAVYVLFSEKDYQLYVGYTSDIFKRIDNHNNGGTPSTKYRRPLKLIFVEYYLFKEDAIYREKYFKSSKGKRALKLILNHTLVSLGYKTKNEHGS
jgi:putative endonuclease